MKENSMNEPRPDIDDPDIDDVAMRERLCDVRVPHDLRARLLSIPGLEKSVLEDPAPTRHRSSRWKPLVWVLASAAGLVASLLAWQYYEVVRHHSELAQQGTSESKSTAAASTEQVPSKSQSAIPIVEPPHAEQLKEWMADHQTRMDAIELEIAELQLVELEQRARQRSRDVEGLSRRERVALAYAVAGEVMHEWAGATPVVQEQLNQVVRVLPDTKGSQLALQILSN
jgi:hypothetical protein